MRTALEFSNRTLLMMLLLLAAAIGILVPGITGPWIFDDFPNIAANPALSPESWGWQEFLKASFSGNASQLGRPVAMASFALNTWLTGLDPWWFKLVNILLHALNAALLFLLVKRLASLPASGLSADRAWKLAAFTALAWAVHPLAVNTSLHVVQRMNLLATGFTLAALLLLLPARQQLFERTPWALRRIALGALLLLAGIFSKESAALAVFYLMLIEGLLFRGQDASGRYRPVIGRLAIATLAMITVAAIAAWPALTANYAYRDFTLVERLLSEPRILWHYIEMTLAPSFYSLGLFLDDIPVSQGLLTPAATLLSIFGLVALALLAFLARRRLPLFSLGLGLFLSGHLLESTFLPLELAFEHRQYLPAAGLLLALMSLLTHPRLERIPVLPKILPLAIIAAFAGLAVLRSLQWSDGFVHAQLEVQHHPQSERANIKLAEAFAQLAQQARSKGMTDWTEFYIQAAMSHYREAALAAPRSPAAHMGKLLLAADFRQPLDEQVLDAAAERIRSTAVRADWPSYLQQLYDCLGAPGCQFDPDAFEVLLRLTLENPELNPRLAVKLYYLAAQYFAVVRRNGSAALELMQAAVDVAPGTFQVHMLQAELLIGAGRLDQAGAALARAREIDWLGIHARDVQRLASKLQDARQSGDIQEEQQP
ncbi:MAG: hypothetical protein R3217_03195 [Gammaproteobacteria bacterium]|nr:hypothetical protein [Gammaproteobacteria bacterium]